VCVNEGYNRCFRFGEDAVQNKVGVVSRIAMLCGREINRVPVSSYDGLSMGL